MTASPASFRTVPRAEPAPRVTRESGVMAVRRPRDYAATARTLAELAYESALAGDADGARSLATDAASFASTLTPDGKETGPALLAVGRALLAVSEAHRARASFESAVLAFDGRGAVRDAAEARLALAEAMLRLHEPAARVVLEDAGTLFEELGDEAASRRVDVALRDAEARFLDSPRSFAVSAVVSRLAR